MKKSTKLISLSLSVLLVVGLLLSTATSATAASETLTGLLAQGTTTEWTLNGDPVDVVFDGASATACYNVSSCASLAAGMLVVVVKDDTTNAASAVYVYGLAENSTATDTVSAITSTDLTLANGTTYRIGSYTTLPGFDVFAGDTVKVTYKPSADQATEANFAIVIEVVNSTTSHTFEGTISALANGNTTWTVKDAQGTELTFTVSSGLWPAVFGVGDQVKITYTVVNGSLVASAVEVQETAVPAKNETARCTNDKTYQPALAKLAAEIWATLPADSGYASVEALQADLVDYFCKGFGIGEIKLAFRYAAGSEYSAQMLLALRAQGYGWGELMKLAKSNPATVDTTSTKQTTSGNQQVNPNKPDKEPKSGRPDQPGKSGKKGKP